MSETRFETLAALLQHAVERFADRPAFGQLRGQDWAWITYAQLAAQVERARSMLAGLGVGRGDRVAVICDNRLEWVLIAHGCYQRRAIFVPMAEAQSEDEWSYILRDCRAKVCFVANSALQARVNALREDLLDLAHIINLEGAPEDDDSFVTLMEGAASRTIKPRTSEPSDVAAIIYTSGTTGEPKGVRLTHHNLASSASALGETRDFGAGPRSMAFLPWSHVFGGQVELNVMMGVGGAIAICQSVDQLYDQIQRVKPTVLYAVPRVWTQLYNQIQAELLEMPEMSRHMFTDGVQLAKRRRQGDGLAFTERIYLNMAEKIVVSKLKRRLGGRLQIAFSGAAPMSREVPEFFDLLGITIYESYGLTESTGSTTTNPSAAPRFGSVGQPIPGSRVEIDYSIDDSDEYEGEVVIYGPGVMEGYHNNDEATRLALTADGGLRTGDLGYLDADGYLHITGRIKDLYKLNSGRYVAPAPLEEKLKLSPFISHCMLYGAGQPYNVALIVADMPALLGYFRADNLTPEQVLSHPRTRRLIEDEILKYSRDFRTFELVRKFWLAAEPPTRENGMLTPALKLRRRSVLRRYEGKLQSLY